VNVNLSTKEPSILSEKVVHLYQLLFSFITDVVGMYSGFHILVPLLLTN